MADIRTEWTRFALINPGAYNPYGDSIPQALMRHSQITTRAFEGPLTLVSFYG